MPAVCPVIHRWSRLLFAMLRRMAPKCMEVHVK
jgi:hypothetical protein